MFGKAITLFKIFGFAVRIDVSWLFIVVLVAWSLAGGVFPDYYKGLSAGTYWVMGFVAALGLFASIVVHEVCHSLVARQYGLPIRGITLFLFGGVAEMAEEPANPTIELLMAVAGPVSSVVLAGAFWASSSFAQSAGWPVPISGVLLWIGHINLLLAAFNLIPGFPLDGGRVLRAILWKWKGDLRRATRTAAGVGAGAGLVLIGLGIVNLLTLNPIGGLWWILIGMFIRAAARQGYQQVLIRQALQGEPVRRFMNDQPVTVPASLPLSRVVDDYVYRYHFKMFPVVDGERLLGCITTRRIKEIPREQWPHRAVMDVLQPCSPSNIVAPDQDAMTTLGAMGRNKVSRLMVVDGERLVGVLALKDLMSFLTLKLELEGESEAPPAPGMPTTKD